MATVRVKANLGIARYMPGEREAFDAEVEAGETVGGFLARLKVPQNAVALMLVNGEKAGPDVALSDGDVLSLLPHIVGG
jgi:molybdopterin converting factor small subunit